MSRLHDKNNLASHLQEVATQTSPCSVSRSSSFDWLNETASEQQNYYPTARNPPENSEYSAGDVEDNSSGRSYSPVNRLNTRIYSQHASATSFDSVEQAELDRIADEEVQRMLRHSEEVRRRLLAERNLQ